MTNDLPSALVSEIVKFKSKSAVVLKKRVYKALEGVGVDIAALEQEAWQEHRDALQARVDRSRRLAENLQRKIESGKIPPDKIAEAKARLLRAPKNIAEHERILKEVIDRQPIWPTAPTLERRQHSNVAAEKIEVAVGQPMAHKFTWPVANLQHFLTSDEFEAANVFRDSFNQAQPKSRVASWDGIPGGGFQGGGLPVTDRQIDAGHRYNALWYSLPLALKTVARNFILEQPPLGHTKPMSRVEFGRAYISCKDKAKASGATDAAIKSTCAALSDTLKEYSAWKEEKKKQMNRGQGNVVPIRRKI